LKKPAKSVSDLEKKTAKHISDLEKKTETRFLKGGARTQQAHARTWRTNLYSREKAPPVEVEDRATAP